MRILITGATGLVGKELGLELVRQGHEIVVVSRDPENAKRVCPFPCQTFTWTDLGLGGPLSSHGHASEMGDLAGNRPQPNSKTTAIGTIDAIVNLAGENVSEGRWTEDKKKSILNSRVSATRSCVDYARQHPSVRVIVSASAIGFYGDRANEIVSEESLPGKGFLADVCQQWEHALFHPELPSDVRRVAIRVGVVLSARGGALKAMEPLFEKGLGGSLGITRKWMSWIHIQDLVQEFIWALNDTRAGGIYNGVTGQPVTNREFAQAFARCFGSRSKIPVPALALKLALGEMADAVTASQRVHNKRDYGKFQPHHENLDEALKNLYPYAAQHEQRLFQQQWIDRTPEEIFPFFCDEKNLEKLTPSFLGFKIQDKSTPQIERGTQIRYQISLRGIPLSWLTEIESWEPPHRFTDVQLKGPYSKWHHTHTFEPLCGGTLMTDEVRFRLPLGWLGRTAGGDFVRADVDRIFDYRRETIATLYEQEL